MSSHAIGRHRRQTRHRERSVGRTGAIAAGAIVTGAALVGGAQAGGLNMAGLMAPQHHDVALTSGGAPTFDQSLVTLLDDLGVGNQTIPGLIGNTVTVGDLLKAEGLDVSSPLSVFFADLNPNDVTLDAATGGLLSESLGTLAGQLYVGGAALDGITLDGLATDLLGADATSTSIYDVLNVFGLGSFAGLVNLCTGADILGVCTGSTITDTSDVSQLLQYLDGGLNPATTTVGDWLSHTDLSGTSTPLANTEVGTVLGLTSTQINEPWNVFLDNLTISAPLAPTETLGNETLGTLLTDLVSVPNLGALGTGDVVTDSTTLAAFLTALDPALATETVDQLLGLTASGSAEAVVSSLFGL